MKEDTKFLIKSVRIIVVALIATIPSFLGFFSGRNTGYSDGYTDGQMAIKQHVIEELDGIRCTKSDYINIYYNTALRDVKTERETNASTISELKIENAKIRENNSELIEENKLLTQQVESFSKPNLLEKHISIYSDSCTYSHINTIHINGKEYSNWIQFDAAHSGLVHFSLRRQYKLFEFALGHVDGSDMCDTSFEIFLDNNLYKTIEGKAGMDIEFFSIPVEDISLMEIRWTQSPGAPLYGFVNPFLS